MTARIVRRQDRPRLDRDVVGADRDADVRAGERGAVVDAVADHRDAVAAFLQLPNVALLVPGEALGEDLVDAEVGGDGVGDLSVGPRRAVVRRMQLLDRMRLRARLVSSAKAPTTAPPDEVQDGGSPARPRLRLARLVGHVETAFAQEARPADRHACPFSDASTPRPLHGAKVARDRDRALLARRGDDDSTPSGCSLFDGACLGRRVVALRVRDAVRTCSPRVSVPVLSGRRR